MHEKINQFLDSVCSHIKYKPVHQDIRDELAAHIKDLTDEYTKKTQNEETALDLAISAMGDCNEIGRQLNKRHKPEPEWSLIVLTAFIVITGGIVMYASSRFESAQAIAFDRYLAYAIMGIAVMTGLYFFDYTKLKRLAWPVYFLSLALLVLILLFGGDINGRRFFIIGDSAVSTEIITLLFMISFAGIVDKARGKGTIAMLKLCVLAAISVLPIMMKLSLSQVLSLLAGYTITIFMAVIKKHFGSNRKRQLMLLGIIACLCAFMILSYIFSTPYGIGRLLAFVKRGQSDPYGSDFQQFIADKWLMASGLFGSTGEKINGGGLDATLPGVTTSYVIINVFVILGRIAGIALIIAIVIYIVRMFIATSRIKNSYGFYLSLVACTVLAEHFVTGILVNFSLLPSTGVYIPFLSYGGVEYICSMALIGLILSVWRRNNLIPVSPENNSDNGGFKMSKMISRGLSFFEL